MLTIFGTVSALATRQSGYDVSGTRSQKYMVHWERFIFKGRGWEMMQVMTKWYGSLFRSNFIGGRNAFSRKRLRYAMRGAETELNAKVFPKKTCNCRSGTNTNWVQRKEVTSVKDSFLIWERSLVTIRPPLGELEGLTKFSFIMGIFALSSFY